MRVRDITGDGVTQGAAFACDLFEAIVTSSGQHDTIAMCPASDNATARPIPEPAPVTNAIFVVIGSPLLISVESP